MNFPHHGSQFSITVLVAVSTATFIGLAASQLIHKSKPSVFLSSAPTPSLLSSEGKVSAIQWRSTNKPKIIALTKRDKKPQFPFFELKQYKVVGGRVVSPAQITFFRDFYFEVPDSYENPGRGGDFSQAKDSQKAVVLLWEIYQYRAKLKLYQVPLDRPTKATVPYWITKDTYRHAKTDGEKPFAVHVKSYSFQDDDWPESARIEKLTSSYVLIRVPRVRSDPTRLRYDFKSDKWSEMEPTKAQLAHKAKLAERREWMGIYKGYRELGQTREQAIKQTREFSHLKDWTPLPQAWDTPAFNPPKTWLTPTPAL